MRLHGRISRVEQKNLRLTARKIPSDNSLLRRQKQRMPENYRDEWRAIKHFEKFPAGSTMISICHNCSAIFEERHPEFFRESIWEFILADKNFPYPNHHGEEITIQDCWRSKENSAEQEAVREILRRMNFKIVELEENHERTKFCGVSLYQPQPPRNPKLAPRRFLHGAQGLFQEHTPEQKNHSCWSTAHKFGRKSRCVLPLLHSRFKIGRSQSISLGATFIRGEWTQLICRN